MFLDIILAGLPIGCIYAFVALGFSLIYSAVRLLHLAQGELIMIGAYIGLWFSSKYGFTTIPSFVMAILIVSVVAVLIERLAYRRIISAHPSNRIICTLAVGIILKNLMQVVTTARPQSLPAGILSGQPLILGSMAIPPTYYLTIIISAITMVGLSLFLLKTKTGLAIRATAYRRDLSGLMGINTGMTLSLSFFIGGALAGIGGILAGKILFIQPTMGFTIAIKGFIAAVLGGWGSLPGAVLGGLLFGLIETCSAGLISSDYKDAITFLLLVFILIFRPRGLLGSDE